jgi:GT2 family glycosyltransferase
LKPLSLKIVAIIATCNRPDLLKSRALASIANQTIILDYLVVCDDSEPENKVINRSIVDSISLTGCSVYYLQNHRSKGASGCWNSAVDLVVREFGNTSNIVLAFLDDDDSWSPEYLETCLNFMNCNQLDMVATGIQRIEGGQEYPVSTLAPDQLNPDLFMVGNPGIQGSNLFLKLDLFLKAGCFDESLSSATDRDLCIRIADLGNVRYSAVQRSLVQHYPSHRVQGLVPKDLKQNSMGLLCFGKNTRAECPENSE